MFADSQRSGKKAIRATAHAEVVPCGVKRASDETLQRSYRTPVLPSADASIMESTDSGPFPLYETTPSAFAGSRSPRTPGEESLCGLPGASVSLQFAQKANGPETSGHSEPAFEERIPGQVLVQPHAGKKPSRDCTMKPQRRAEAARRHLLQRRDFIEFLEGLLQVDPFQRFSVEEALRHSFVSSAVALAASSSGSQEVEVAAEHQYRKWRRVHLQQALKRVQAEQDRQQRQGRRQPHCGEELYAVRVRRADGEGSETGEGAQAKTRLLAGSDGQSVETNRAPGRPCLGLRHASRRLASRHRRGRMRDVPALEATLHSFSPNSS